MNSAYLNYKSFAKYALLTVTLLLGMFFASQIHGQELEILDDSAIELDSVLDHGQQSLVPVPQVALEVLVDQSTAFGEPVECEVCGPQAIETKEICLLKKRVVCVAAQDEVWLVSARKAHLCRDLSQIDVRILQNGNWQTSSLDSLTTEHSIDKSKTTLVYCHGNRTDLSWAKSRGLQVYQNLFESNCKQGECRCTRPPVRFVIFAWKSEQEKIRLCRDYQIKSKRAPIVGKTFGRFLGQFGDRDMVLSGFSLGSQVILTGLSGCESSGRNLPGRYQVCLVAPALAPSFVCGSLGGLADNCLVQRTEVFANEKDRAIKAAQKIAARTCREWLPEFKKLELSSGNAVNPIRVTDVGNDISRQHSTENYYSSNKVRCLHLEMLKQVTSAQISTVTGIPAAGEPVLEQSGQLLLDSVPVESPLNQTRMLGDIVDGISPNHSG